MTDTAPNHSRTRDQIAFWGIVIAAAVLLVCGWKLFWFLTDDAYISFRYVSNSVAGLGYVWNAPPFRPVEGYTNFLWVVLLDIVWRITGAEPPVSANWLSLGFALGTLVLTAKLIWHLPWNAALKSWRPLFLALALLGTVTNRTFLAWSSSGLETALFGFLVTSWIYLALCTRSARAACWWGLSLAAAGIALTRPDGLLFCAATVTYTLLNMGQNRITGSSLSPDGRGQGEAASRMARLLALAPLLLVVAHLLWRHRFYGAWLPNTFYAKNAGAWFESGWRYAASFLLEYGLWVWGVLAVGWGLHAWHRQANRTFQECLAIVSHPVCMVTVTLLIHAAYYTLLVGGDHFEYRVYNHLVPLFGVTLIAFLLELNWQRWAALLCMIVALAVSLPLPWTHWALSQRVQTREVACKVAVAPAWPRPVRAYAALFDRLQAWLIDHYVCARHQEHKIACQWWLQSMAPPRKQGATISGDDFPVMVAYGGIGGLGWVLPHVNIIDLYGLNDYVVARTPLRPGHTRRMAHDRSPPRGYSEAFRPNVTQGADGIRVLKRDQPLTADDIRAAEAEWAKRVGGHPPAIR